MPLDKTPQDNAGRLGVVAICRNEENDLPGFLDNLLPLVDEVIVVDDGSTDSSKDILRNAGPRVKLIEQSMEPDTGFSGLRNRGLQEASTDWILHMDIDERVPADLAEEIRSSIQSTTYNAYRYRRLNFFLHRPMKGGGFQDWNNPQLARNGKHHFENAVHERCVVEGAPEAIGQLKEKIWHLNDESYRERMEKSFVYCQNQARRFLDREMNIRWYHFILIPFVEFLRKFFKKRGYSDRTLGLLWALHSAGAMFRACALVWDKQNRIKRSDIEKELADRSL